MVLDLDKTTLCKYKIGDVAPCEFNGEHLHDKQKGYAINIYEGAISSLFICLSEGYEGFNQFLGKVKYRGEEFLVNSNTTKKFIIDKFGEPSDSWNDGVEKCLEYRLNGLDLEIVWNVDGEECLKHISLCI